LVWELPLTSSGREVLGEKVFGFRYATVGHSSSCVQDSSRSLHDSSHRNGSLPKSSPDTQLRAKPAIIGHSSAVSAIRQNWLRQTWTLRHSAPVLWNSISKTDLES